MSDITSLETEYIPILPHKYTNKELLWRRQIETDLIKARVYLGLLLFVSIVTALLLSGILGCLAFIVIRLFFW